ncbi:Uncharacterised protein [uncultured Faecalibacterium sp.]|jgi:hypothetical protein|nr:Uncharacterised protein [uncultured Faecalibacterium sp.]
MMKQMSKCTTTIFASILIALCLTSCTPEKVVEVVREVETVREVVIREEPRENIILEDELVAMMNDHFYGINSLIQRFETNREVAAMAENVAKMNGIRTAIRGGAHLDTVSDELSQELVKNGDTNAYYVSYFKNVAYESEYFESIKRRLILEEINDHVALLEPPECTFESAKVQVGFASVQIDEMTYGIIVFQIPTVRPAEAETIGMFS